MSNEISLEESCLDKGVLGFLTTKICWSGIKNTESEWPMPIDARSVFNNGYAHRAKDRMLFAAGTAAGASGSGATSVKLAIKGFPHRQPPLMAVCIPRQNQLSIGRFSDSSDKNGR